jgi:hypothetical protein
VVIPLKLIMSHPPLAGALACGVFAFVVSAIVGASVSGEHGAIRWFRPAVVISLAVFCVTLALFSLPESGWAG